MFIRLNHQTLDVYGVLDFLVECYRFTNKLPTEEKFGMAAQIRRAALSVHLNIAEGFSRKSATERKRYFEISRGSVIEIDAALDAAEKLGYCSNYDRQKLCDTMLRTFEILCKLIKALTNKL